MDITTICDCSCVDTTTKGTNNSYYLTSWLRLSCNTIPMIRDGVNWRQNRGSIIEKIDSFPLNRFLFLLLCTLLSPQPLYSHSLFCFHKPFISPTPLLPQLLLFLQPLYPSPHPSVQNHRKYNTSSIYPPRSKTVFYT